MAFYHQIKQIALYFVLYCMKIYKYYSAFDTQKIAFCGMLNYKLAHFPTIFGINYSTFSGRYKSKFTKKIIGQFSGY